MKKLNLFFWVTIIFLLFTCQTVRADWKPYAFSYSYPTIPQGKSELELYTDYQAKENNYRFKNQLEFEHGITERWMATLYGVFAASNTSGYSYSQTKVQTRYRFGEAGQYFLDPAIYLEYIIPASGSHVVEFKEILSRDFGDFNFTTNLIFEKELKEGTSWEKGYTLAVGRKLSKTARIGLELKGNEVTAYLAPSAFFWLGDFRVTAASGFGLNPASDAVLLRIILAHDL